MEHRNQHWYVWWTLWLCVGALMWAGIFAVVTHAAWSESTISPSGLGMTGPPSLSASAVCRNAGHEAVWIAETGSDYLDIIQVGDMDGTLFYAYGRGVPNGPGSLYREIHLGPAGTGPHRYGISLASRVWTISIDGRVVARIPDSFRTWPLRATQVMAEGTLPFGAASCSSAGRWRFGGYGPAPRWSFGTDRWAIR